MTVARDIMTPVPKVLQSSDTVQQAASLMATKGVGVVPVFEADGRLRSMITDRDIVVRLVAVAKDPAAFTLAEITEPTDVVTVDAEASVDEILDAMKRHRVRRLPVTDGVRIVGIVSQADLAGKGPADKLGDLGEAMSA